MADRQLRRLDRQFRALSRLAPGLAAAIGALRGRSGFLLRFPLAVLLVIGGLLSFLPILGLWMVPLGLLLLAIDLPVLRPAVSAAIIRLRRRWTRWRRRRRSS
ncbi:hypothetical protein [Oceanibacterium hippocampi]|uniref:Transmembrane protein (PGPGW) n=1 Tax=Oceanibacterium hippocampi TaxID=745714 RepID=A0A1Y5U4C1_9PROT|nr:hypothetical protein [Oceanibacterium hippocampi]SLN76614.1 hypothetical protein OCH7691_04149 [Oceanibacterium hippocampi]